MYCSKIIIINCKIKRYLLMFKKAIKLIKYISNLLFKYIFVIVLKARMLSIIISKSFLFLFVKVQKEKVNTKTKQKQ